MRADGFARQLIQALARQTPAFRSPMEAGPGFLNEVRVALCRSTPAFSSLDPPDAARHIASSDIRNEEDTKERSPDPSDSFVNVPAKTVDSVCGVEQKGAQEVAEPDSFPMQEPLISDDLLPDNPISLGPIMGFRASAVLQIAGITDQQLDYWIRAGLVVPSLREKAAPGGRRLYSLRDVLTLKIVKRLLDTGVALSNIRMAVEHLRRYGIHDLARITLFSDGTTVYECTTPEEVVDLLQRGQGVFGIAVSGALREIASSVRDFPQVEARQNSSEESNEDVGPGSLEERINRWRAIG